VVTFDYSGAAATDLTPQISSETAIGFQYYRREVEQIGATGSELPAPGMTTVSSAAIRDGSETFLANATVGVYLQQQFGLNNRAFLTAAIRADDNSAFGAEFDAAIYPKVSATWVISEEPFWRIGAFDQLRLRGAWGAAGQQPGTFDAARLLQPSVGFGDQPVLRPLAFGNPQLRPERGEELELGFDADVLDGRLNVVYTRFERNTKDAIVAQALPRSLGWPGSQIVNLGRVRGWGNELALDFRAYEGRTVAWDIGTQLSNFRNRIEDLGPDRDFLSGTGSTRHHVGYSIGDIFYRTVLHAEIDENGQVIEALCDGGTGPYGVDRGGEAVPCSGAPFVRWGHSQPTWDIGVNSTVQVGDFRFYGRVDAAGGHYQQDSSSPAAITSLVLTEAANRRNDPLVQAYSDIGRAPLGTYRAGFARLREVSAQYALPSAWTDRLGVSRGTVTLAGRNLMMLWTQEHGWSTRRDGLVEMPIGDGKVWDPETRGIGDLSGEFQTVMPPLTSLNLTVRFSL
jgi:TonB-dependent starch-binding outer membrane protein SusC